jgi:hypothetical protein
MASRCSHLVPHPYRSMQATPNQTTPSLISQTFNEETDFSLTSDSSASISSRSVNRLASRRSAARASGARGRRDTADVQRVLKTMKEVKDHTYKVKKGGPGGKYLIQRTLHYSAISYCGKNSRRRKIRSCWNMSMEINSGKFT